MSLVSDIIGKDGILGSSLLFSGADVIEPSVDMTSCENRFGDKVGLKMAYTTHKYLFFSGADLIGKEGIPPPLYGLHP